MISAVYLATRYWRVLLVGLAISAIVALALVNVRHVAQRDAARASLAAEQASHRETVATYQAAAAIAARRDAENLARVQREQRAITERVTDDYQGRLADSTAAYQRLRTQADAYSGSSGTADVSAARDATCRAYASAPCDELPALLKAAQDNTDQLLALIAWTNGQGAVIVEQGDR